MPLTPNYSWTKPTVGGSNGSWGTILNTLFDDIDAQVKSNDDAAAAAQTSADAAQTTANAALPKAGGTMTGNLQAKTADADKQSFSGSGTKAIDASVSNIVEVTSTTGNITFSISGVPASGRVYSLLVRVTTSGAHTVTWFAGVKWSNGSVPVQTASGTDVYSLFTSDGGTTWYGARVMIAAA